MEAGSHRRPRFLFVETMERGASPSGALRLFGLRPFAADCVHWTQSSSRLTPGIFGDCESGLGRVFRDLHYCVAAFDLGQVAFGQNDAFVR